MTIGELKEVLSSSSLSDDTEIWTIDPSIGTYRTIERIGPKLYSRGDW